MESKRKYETSDYLDRWAQMEQRLLQSVAAALLMLAAFALVAQPFTTPGYTVANMELITLGFPLALVAMAAFLFFRSARYDTRRDIVARLADSDSRILFAVGALQLGFGLMLALTSLQDMNVPNLALTAVFLLFGGFQMWRGLQVTTIKRYQQ